MQVTLNQDSVIGYGWSTQQVNHNGQSVPVPPESPQEAGVFHLLKRKISRARRLFSQGVVEMLFVDQRPITAILEDGRCIGCGVEEVLKRLESGEVVAEVGE